jgi:hypothetical protein
MELKRIEEGDDKWEGMKAAWLAERKPGHLQLKGGVTYKVLLPEGEPIFVPVASGVDNFYGSTTSVPGQG